MPARALAAVMAVVLGTPLLPAQSAVPSGFRDEVVATGLVLPVALAVLPDGRLLCAEKNSGVIRVVRPDGVSASTGAVPDLNTTGFHRGFQGIAVDPQWPTRPYIYAYYTATAPPQHMRLAMYTMTGDLANPASTNLALGQQYVILNAIPDNHEFHNGGTIAFGPDGKLYAFVGDDNDSCLAPSLASLAGKVLRLDVSGLPHADSGPPPIAAITPAGNPFTAPAPNAPLIWAFGFRNPFRADIDPVTGTLFIADVGDTSWEEIDVCTAPGVNFGWPAHEGIPTHVNACGAAPSNPIAPVAQHHHLAAPDWSAAVISLALYRNPAGAAPYAFGPAYEGSYFYADHVDGRIRRLQQTGGTWGPAAEVPGQPASDVWALVAPNDVTDAAVGPDGALYYTALLSGQIRRIRGGAPAGVTLKGSLPCESAVQASPNVPVSFTMTATAAPVAGALVTLSAIGIPPGASVVPPLPATGPSVQVTINWTPSFAEVGRWNVLFKATDASTNDQTVASVRTCGLSLFVADAVLVGSGTQSGPIAINPGQDFLLVDPNGASMYPVVLDWPPVFAVPNDPTLMGTHIFAQVVRYNPVLDPADPLKLSNGVNIFVGDEMINYGPSSGMTLTHHPLYRPLLGSLTTVVVTIP